MNHRTRKEQRRTQALQRPLLLFTKTADLVSQFSVVMSRFRYSKFYRLTM